MYPVKMVSLTSFTQNTHLKWLPGNIVGSDAWSVLHLPYQILCADWFIKIWGLPPDTQCGNGSLTLQGTEPIAWHQLDH